MNPNGYLALIGMPGCGKSTLGRRLAGALGMRCADLDEEIERASGETIPSLFERGEACFRAWETRVLEAQTPMRYVLACGGGVVVTPKNRALLARGGFTVYIDRPVPLLIQNIDIAAHPLLSEGAQKLYALYAARKALYAACADATIRNDASLDEALARLINAAADWQVRP